MAAKGRLQVAGEQVHLSRAGQTKDPSTPTGIPRRGGCRRNDADGFRRRTNFSSEWTPFHAIGVVAPRVWDIPKSAALFVAARNTPRETKALSLYWAK